MYKLPMKRFRNITISITLVLTTVNLIGCICEEGDPNNNFALAIINGQSEESLITADNIDNLQIINLNTGEEPETNFYEGIDYNFVSINWHGDYILNREETYTYTVNFLNRIDTVEFNFKLKEDESCDLFEYAYMNVYVNDSLVSTDESKRLAIIKR